MATSFKVGDKVEYEVGHLKNPRWNMNKDTGGIGEYVTAIVTQATHTRLTTLYVEPDGFAWRWEWPTPSDDVYASEQWDRPGYLRHVKEED